MTSRSRRARGGVGADHEVGRDWRPSGQKARLVTQPGQVPGLRLELALTLLAPSRSEPVPPDRRQPAGAFATKAWWLRAVLLP